MKSAARALEIVECVAEAGALSFNDIVARLGLPKSSAHGLLRTLEGEGWLVQESETRRFTLGLKVWQLGQRYDGHRGLAETAKPIMDALARSTGETVQLARLDGVENVYIAISLSPNPMRMASTVGMRLHAHATGIGKALLSTLDPGEARRRLSAVVLPRLTARTVTDPDELMRIVTRTADVGYAVDDEEFVEGCRCVAVPLTAEGETGIAAALSVTLPTQRTPDGWPRSLYAPLAHAAEEIRAAMGL
ncbi:IclR family transcriptional regulator [Microbacterium marinilacus]|uniref:IclR family transcriptional regulator n=1 Tax=Microbacterium marinilacus TaxID=415209 RepID=UPI0027E079BD|nr:IclR family transcriptional regulator [Microbacterium marinilacus]